MTEKKVEKKAQTKAGMLGKKSLETDDQPNEKKTKKDSGTTPKINKENAEGKHDDKPIH
jgi:hypothetical protein